jgi:hypothetical protein
MKQQNKKKKRRPPTGYDNTVDAATAAVFMGSS